MCTGFLKNFSRLDEEEFKAVNIHEGIDSTLEIIQYLCENRIEIIKDYADLPHLRCKANQINQVFMNLFVNACQAIEGDGKIFIQTQLKDDTIDVAINDTGVGIASENLEKVFDPGYTTKGVGVGTGLGLSIAYKIIEDHGGSIEVAITGAALRVFTPCTMAVEDPSSSILAPSRLISCTCINRFSKIVSVT